MFPGIPSDYESWPEAKKLEWLEAYPHALACQESERDIMDMSTMMGIRERIKALTGDDERARSAAAKWVLDQTADKIMQNGLGNG